MLNPQGRFSVQPLPGVAQIAAAHRLAGQQHDNLCGPYWVAILLRSQAISTTPEQIAQLAGSVLPTGDPQTWLPMGALPRQDYQSQIPTADCLKAAGTSALGLLEAVSVASAGAYCLVPLQTEWTADRVQAAMELCHSHPEWNAIPLCNLRTGHLWGTDLAVADAIAYLNGQTITAPPADWNVGHFLALAGTVEGEERALILVCDTYPRFGWQGYHLQTAATIAAALNRGDGYRGGILLFISSHNKDEVEQQAQAQGFSVAIWDNGSPIKAKN